MLAATVAILAFVGGHLSFGSPFFGFGRNLPRVRVCYQLKASLKIHERSLPTLHPTPTSGAFPSRGHSASTFATHGTETVGMEGTVFISFVQERPPRPWARPRPRPRPRRGGDGGGLGLDVSGGGATYRGSPSSISVHRGDGIGVRDIAKTSATSTLLSIFIQKIQSSP